MQPNGRPATLIAFQVLQEKEKEEEFFILQSLTFFFEALSSLAAFLSTVRLPWSCARSMFQRKTLPGKWPTLLYETTRMLTAAHIIFFSKKKTPKRLSFFWFVATQVNVSKGDKDAWKATWKVRFPSSFARTRSTPNLLRLISRYVHPTPRLHSSFRNLSLLSL